MGWFVPIIQQIPVPVWSGDFLVILALIYDLNPPTAHSGAPCRLRRRPPVGGSLSLAAPLSGNHAAAFGLVFCGCKQPANRRSSFGFRAPPGRRRSRGGTAKGGGWDSIINQMRSSLCHSEVPAHPPGGGAVKGPFPPKGGCRAAAGGTSKGGGLRSRAAACGRYRRGGAGAAVCFLQAGSVPRRKNRVPQPGGFRS